jgi:elongation factor Tu
VRDILNQYEFVGADAPCIKGSALLALEDKEPELGEKKVLELLDVMDNKIPIPKRDIDKPFLMSIESTYNIEGRGTVATGTVEQGRVKAGEEIEIVGYEKKARKTIATGIETFNKLLDHGEAGDNVGILIRGLTRKEVFRG